MFFILFAWLFRFDQHSVTLPGNDREVEITHTYSYGLKERAAQQNNENWVVDYDCDSLREWKQALKELNEGRKDYFQQDYNKFQHTYEWYFLTFFNYYVFPYAYRHQMYDMDTPVNYIYNKYFQVLPKIFFLLMPLLALLLYASFFRRRGYQFVDYAVMSLHTHVFLFLSAMFLGLVIGSFTNAVNNVWLLVFLVVIPLIHFIIGCRRFFKNSWIYTVLVGIVTWGVYCIMVIATAVFVLLAMIHWG